MRDEPHGFSAIELLVVIAIAATLLGWGYPRLATLVQIYRLDGAAWALAAEMQEVRLRAIQEARPFRVVFDVANRTYQVQSDPGGGWQDEQAAREIEDARMLGVALLPTGASPHFTTRGVLQSGSAARVTLTSPSGLARNVYLELGGKIHVN